MLHDQIRTLESCCLCVNVEIDKSTSWVCICGGEICSEFRVQRERPAPVVLWFLFPIMHKCQQMLWIATVTLYSRIEPDMHYIICLVITNKGDWCVCEVVGGCRFLTAFSTAVSISCLHTVCSHHKVPRTRGSHILCASDEKGRFWPK